MGSKKNKGKKSFNIVPAKEKSQKSKYQIPTQSPGYHKLHPYFSFRYYHEKHKKFTFGNFVLKDFKMFIERVHKMSQYTWGQINNEMRRHFHFHEVNWKETSVRGGFMHLPKELKEYPVVQFELFKECRVLGFFNADNVFKIVWIDRGHNIYKGKGR